MMSFPSSRLCTKNTSRALIERPYSCAPQAVGAVYDRPGFFVQSRLLPNQLRPELNLARSCDGRRLQRSIAWNVCSPTVDEGCHAGTKVSPVQQIESLSSELNLHL